MTPKHIFASTLILISLLTSPMFADVRLPNVISSHMVLQQEKPVHIWGWAEPGEQVEVSFAGQTKKTKADASGKWLVALDPLKANKTPATMNITGKNTIKLDDLLVGEVWVCSGQSNMEWNMTQTEKGKDEIPKANHPQIRLYNVVGHIKKPQPQEDAPGTWQACTPESVKKFSGVGYYFGKDLQAKLDVPIGLIGSNWGGTQIEPWTPKVGLEQVDSLKASAKNGGIYNGMIHPLAPYSFRGIIWYQGESNCVSGDTDIYTDRSIAMVKGWESVFQQDDLSFYFVQIAPFPYSTKFKNRNKEINTESLPRFWDAQTACLDAIPDCGMVVITDITGNVNDIHPRNKRDVGARLARWAMAKNYGDSNMVYSGPKYKTMSAKGKQAILEFDYSGSGLKSLDGKPLSQFMIAGGDKKFVEATAKVVGNTVVVEAAGVDKPTAVRFGWEETVIGNLGNQEGLPAIPFRTDSW